LRLIESIKGRARELMTFSELERCKVVGFREEHKIGKDWKGLELWWAKEEGLFASKSVGLMKVLFAPDAASSHSRLWWSLVLELCGILGRS
jgi:hypothetical protein